MATEADNPQPVPLMENVHLTAEKFNQPPEPTDSLLKSVHAHESSNLQNEAAHIDTKDDLGVSKGECFLKSSLDAKVASEDTCRKQEPFEAVKIPQEAEKHLEENEKQIHTNENFDSAERVSKEKDATAEITGIALNVGENSEFVDSTEIMKIEEPELEVQETNQQVEEIVNVNIEIDENTNDYNKEDKTTNTGGYAEADTSKEVDKPEGILDQNTEVSAQTPNLTLNSTDGGVQTIKEARLKDETENCTVGTDATHIEGSVTEQSAAGAEEKQPKSCSSFLNVQSSETIKLSEKESSNDSVVADSLCTHNDQIAISESKEVAEDEPDVSSVSPATDSSAIEETDLIVHETEKTTSVACTTESQEPIELSENMKDTSQIADEMQEERVEDVPVTEMDIYMQKEDNSVSEDTVKEIPEEIGVSEVVEKPGKTDRSEADKVKDEINPEQGVSDVSMKPEEGERSIEVEVSAKETSGEEKNGGEDAAKESEIDLSDATTPAAAEENKVEIKDHEIDLHGSSIQNDELKNEKIEKSRNEAIEGTDKMCSGENIAAITCTEEEAVFQIQEESSIEKHGKEKSTDIDVNNDDTISNKMDVPPTEPTDKTESAEVEISNAAENEKLEKVQDVDGDQKESNYNRTNTDETVEKKEDSCEVQMSKLETREEPDKNGKYNCGKVTSDEVIDTAFVEEETEQSSQPGVPQEKATALRYEIKENENVYNAENEESSCLGSKQVEDGPEILGIGEVTAEQRIEGDGTQILAEPINEDTVNISQDTVEVAEVSGKEDDDKQITEESLKGLSQESVEECLDKHFQNEQKSIDISSGEVHEEAETGKPVDDISSDTTQNDEISASTLQTYQEKEEGSLQTEEAQGKDIELMIKDKEPENNEMLEEVKENKETELSICRLKRTKKHEEDLQNNESVENLQEITGVVTTETEKDDSSKTTGTAGDETVESPQDNVIEEETQNDEKNCENSNIESLGTSENDENSNSTVEACLTKEQEFLKDENSTPKEASATAELHGNSSSEIKDEKLENNAVQTEVKEKIEESMEHEENLEQTQINKPVENLKEPNIVEPSETKNHVSDEIIKDLEVETVEKDGSDIKEDNAVFEAVDEDISDRKADTAEGEVVNKDENDSYDKAESETIEKDNFDQADNAEVKTFEEDTVDKKEDIAAVETVEGNNPQKVVDDAEVEKIEKDAPEVETVEEYCLDKNAEVEIVEKDDLDKKDDDNKVEVKEAAADKSPDNAEVETINEDDVAKTEKADSTCNEAKADTGEQEYLEEQIINDGNDSAPLEYAEPSPLGHSETDAENAEDSNNKDIELSKSTEKDDNIADDANQKDEIPSTCISTSLIKEAKKSHEECETVPSSQTSPDKKEEDVSQIELAEDNENTVALETNASVDEEPSKEVGDSNEKSQYEESTNTTLQTSRVEEQEILDSDNQAEADASPADLKDEDQSYIKTDENNDNDAVVLEVEEENQEEKLKDEESISMISEETMGDASSKTTGELENAKTPDDIGKDSEVAKEENAIQEASDPVISQNEEYNENSSREILGEFETVRTGENIAQEKDQKDESLCTTPPSSSVGKEERPMHEYADATSAEVSIDEHREKENTPVNSGENNDCNVDKIELNVETSKSEEIVEQATEKKQMEGVEETSKNEEKLEEEPPKNQPEELLEQSSNFVVVESDAVTLNERAIDTSLGEVVTIQNDEGKIEEGKEEKEETGKIDQVEKAAMEEVSTETKISVTIENTEKHLARKEETEIDILSQPAEKETSSTEAQDASDTVEQAPEESDTVEQAPEVENIVKDQPNEIDDEKMNEDEMIISASKQEVDEIIQTAERDDSTEKQMTVEGNAIKDKAKEPKIGTDRENSEEKEIQKESNEAELKEKVDAPKSEATGTIEASNSEEENKNKCNVAELKEEVEEPKSDAIGIIEASSSEEAKGYETSETKEGSELLPAACTDSLPEISSSKSEDKDEIMEKEEPNANDISSLSVTEGAKEISLGEPETDDKVQTESSIPTSEESELKYNSEETTPNYVPEEQMNEGENKDQETLEAVNQVKEDTDTLEKETNSEAGFTTKSEARSNEEVEMEKLEVERKGDIDSKAEVDISNETVQMEERAIVFEEAISKERNSTAKAEVSSKEDAEMNSETIEPEVPISAEENSEKEVEEASSKEAMEEDKFTTEPETAILEGALTTKPEASSKEAIEVDNKEIKPEEVISKEEDSAKNNELSLKEFEAGKVTVEPEIAISEAENPVATVEVSSETAFEVEKAESEPEAAAFKEGDSATKAEVALNKDAEKEATQPEAVISQEVDPATEVEESSDAAITNEEDSAKNTELSLKEVEAKKIAVEPDIATSEAENPVAMVEVSSETATEVEKAESKPEAAAAFKEGDSATKAEAASNEVAEAAKEATQPEVVVSEKVDSVTQVEEICEVAISEGKDLAIEVEKAAIEPEAAIPKEKDSATEFEAASEEDTAVQKSTTQPGVAILGEVDSVTKLEKANIEPERAICEERDSATELKAVSEDDVAVEKSITEPDLTISEEADSVTKVGGSAKEAEEEKVDIDPEAAIFEERDSGTEFKVAAEDVETEKSTTEPEVAIYEELNSATTVGRSTQEADEVEKQDTEPDADISIEKDSATAFEAASEDIEAHKSTTEHEVATSKEVDPAIMVGGSTKEAYELEKQDTEPEANILKEKDSATEFEAASKGVEVLKSPTEPEVTISEEENSVAKVGGSTKEADEVEKQDAEPEEAISKEKDSATEFEVASEQDEEVQKPTTEPEVAISEVDSVITVGGCKKEADELEKQDIEPDAAASKKTNSALEFKLASEEDVKAEKLTTEPEVAIPEEVDSATEFTATSEDVEAQKSTTEPEVVISEEAAISKEKDSTTEFEAAKEKDAEVQKSTTESEVALSEEVYSLTNIGESTKQANKVEKRDNKPEAAMSIVKDFDKDSVTECDAASEEDAKVQKLTIKTEVAISEEMDSATKVERSIIEADEVEKSNTCGEKDSDVEASLTEAAEVEKADICKDNSDRKVEASLNEAVEVEKVAAETEASVHEAEDSDAKVEMTKDNADVKKEAAVQRELVTEAELREEAVEEEKEATKAEEAISEAVVSGRNLEDRSVKAVEDEKAQMELDGSVSEVDSQANKIHETPMDSNIESSEPGKKVDCSSEIGTSGQGDEMVSETTKSETEENRNDAPDHSSESTEKNCLHESQDIQLDIRQKVEATVEVEEYIKEAPKTDDTIEVATLSTEVHGDVEKNDAKELHSVSVQEERINNVKVCCSESIESLNATESDSNEVQKIAETSLEEAQVNDNQVQVPNVPSNSSSHGTEIEGSERNIAVETIESQVLSSDLASKASNVVADENVVEVKPQDENADIVEERRKESETVAESKDEELYTAETEAEVEVTVEEMTEKEHGTAENTEVDETKESKRDSGEIGEKTKEVSQETLVSQDESTVLENDIPIVKIIPEEVKKEKCETQENTEVAEKETPENVEVAESRTDSDIVEESPKQELCSAETGEVDAVTSSIDKNQDKEEVIEKEIIVLQKNSEEEKKEQQETASPVLPSKEEACETKAAEEIEQNKREILSKADETPESSSEQKTTEEVNLQQEEPKVMEVSKLETEIKSGEEYTNYEKCGKKEQSPEEIKDEIKQSFVGAEPATEVVVASDQILTEKASEVQNKRSPDELVLEEHEHGTWTVIEKTEQSIDETEVLKHIAKETEESCFDKEESKKAKVSTKEATETHVGAVQIVNEGPESTYDDSRETGEIKDNQLSSVPSEERKGQDEVAVISKEIQMDSPNENVEEKIKEVGSAIDENLPEKAAVSDKILDRGTETCEEKVTFGLESRSHKGLVESEAETDPKVPGAALTQSITEKNLSKETIEETESIPNEVKKEQIELEKEGAKDCLSISHGKETTKDKHVECELKAEDSNVNEKEKNIEEVHVEEEEADARKTIVDQINNEKRTVEQPRQAVAEDVMEKIIEKEAREVKPPLEEVKRGELSKEVPTGITRVTKQEEYFNATPENQITREAEPEKTTEVTTETTEKIETIGESTESAKISLFDMMQRSTREKQATIQEYIPKDEVKTETEQKTKSDEEKEDEEDDEEHKNNSGSDAPVMVEASKDIDFKVPHKKSHNILSGVGSKVKHSISKVKKAITGKSSHSKQNSPKSGTKEQVNPGH